MKLLAALVLVAACDPSSISASDPDGGGSEPAADAASAIGDSGAPPPDDLGAAQAFVADLTLGYNVERAWAWEVGSPEYFAYLHDTMHATHVRLFYPWRPTVEMGGGGAGNSRPDAGQLDRIVQAAANASGAGLKVFVDCLDVMGYEDFEGAYEAEVDAHVTLCGERFAAAGLDPARVAVGPVNEWAGGENSVWNPIRLRLHELLRAQLPEWVLTTGAAYWKSRDTLYDAGGGFEPFDDLRVVYDWHHYSSLDAAGWQGEAEKLAAWRQANGGRPTFCGECGPGWWDEPVDGGTLQHAPWVWPERYDQQLPAVAAERPTIWAITYGNAYRHNKDWNDPYLMDGSGGSPDLASALVDDEAVIRSLLGL